MPRGRRRLKPLRLSAWCADAQTGTAREHRLTSRLDEDRESHDGSQSYVHIFTALVCLAAAGCAATTTRDSTGQYIDDSAITTKVKAALFNDPSLKSDEISVETFKSHRFN